MGFYTFAGLVILSMNAQKRLFSDCEKNPGLTGGRETGGFSIRFSPSSPKGLPAFLPV
jgi:hypothetical protein